MWKTPYGTTHSSLKAAMRACQKRYSRPLQWDICYVYHGRCETCWKGKTGFETDDIVTITRAKR